MQFSPLQSRLAASLIASCLLIALYFTLFTPHFALAAEVPGDSPIVLDDADFSPASQPRGSLNPVYEPEFSAFDRSILGRAPAGVSALTNNEATSMNVVAGSTERFVFTVDSIPARAMMERTLELRGEHNANQLTNRDNEPREAGPDPDTNDADGLVKRQASRTVYISANTCEQPRPLVASNTTTTEPPQLTLYVSKTDLNQSPGPLADTDSQFEVEFTEGAVMFNLTVSGDVYIGVHAPNATGFTTDWNFKVAASTDAYFYTYNEKDDADLIWVDSDAQGALLITHNLTESYDPVVEQKIMSSQPYVMFAQNSKDTSISGLKYSYCGLQINSQIAATKNGQFASMVSTGMTKRGQGNLPKQQFFFSGLNSSADYLGILARDGSSTVSGNGLAGAGGHVFKATQFSTKSDHGNCGIVFNLTFCDQIAYSVPSNPNFGNSTKLAQFYDDYAREMYENFDKSLQQVACEAPSNQRYSLARNCSQCAAAYKDWLCLVTIPRCEDFDNPAPYLHPRAMNQKFPNGEALDDAAIAQVKLNYKAAYNTSRNPRIDETIVPGPYKEVLPCEDLCYNIVQSCPSSLGFSCPVPGQVGFSSSYGRRQGDELSCNYPGSAHFSSSAVRLVAAWAVPATVTLFVFLLL
ncbi:stretch-activated Ca2+-permeable channel component-domain-containing protein [Cercophora newfieldiana]|uniref:Stretch-activated Ca2+-permeable channel component-domain-containing protein n=1 Tax=Cercophora newfieldiana TaxID=92897 RepID=A0AA39YGD5_9PEZI|nr:stretch-activated Ca2+-permeable channel component-domain-containing protein [Cercophora newfieldiana]